MATDINSDIQKLSGLWNAYGKNDQIKPITDMDKQEMSILLCIMLELYESCWSWNVENNVGSRKHIQSCLRRLNLDYLIKGSTELEGSNSKVTRLVGALWEKLQEKYGSSGLKQRCLQVQMKRQKQYQQKQEKSVSKRTEEQNEAHAMFTKLSLDNNSLLELQKEERISSANLQDMFVDRKIPSGKELPRTPVLPLSRNDSSDDLVKIKKVDEEPQSNLLKVLSTPVAVGQALLSGKQDQITLEGSFVVTPESQIVEAEIRVKPCEVEHLKGGVNKMSSNETQTDTPIQFDKSDLTRLNQKGCLTVYMKDRKIPKGKEIPRTPIKGVSIQTLSERKLSNSFVIAPKGTPKSRHDLKTCTHVSQETHQLSQQDLRLQDIQPVYQNNEDFSSQISEYVSTETRKLQPNDRTCEQTSRCQSNFPVLKSLLSKSNVSSSNGEIFHIGNIKVVDEPSVERVNQLKGWENNSTCASENTEIENQLSKIKEESVPQSTLTRGTKKQELETRRRESVKLDDSSFQKTFVEEDKTSNVKSITHSVNLVDQHSNSFLYFEKAYNSTETEETVTLNRTFTIEDDTSFLKNENTERISEDVTSSTISSSMVVNVKKIETDDSEKFELRNCCQSQKHKIVSTFSSKGQNLCKETKNKSYVSEKKQIQCESPTGSHHDIIYKGSSVDVISMKKKDKTKEEPETCSLLKGSTRHIYSLESKPNNRGRKKHESSFVIKSLLETADISEKPKAEQEQVTMSQENNTNTIKGKLSKFDILPELEKTNNLNIMKKIESSECDLSRNESDLIPKKTGIKKTKNICSQLITPQQGMKMVETRSKTASKIIKNTCSKSVISPDHCKRQTIQKTKNTDSKVDVEYEQENLETAEKKRSTNEDLFNTSDKNKTKQERKYRKTKQNTTLELKMLKKEKSTEQRIGSSEIISTLQDASNDQEKATNRNQTLVENVKKTTHSNKVELTSSNPNETIEISTKTRQDIKPEFDIKDDLKELSVGKRTARKTQPVNITELDSTKDQKSSTFTKKSGRVGNTLENSEVNLDITCKQENITQLNTTDVLQTTGELDSLTNRNNLKQENKVGPLNKKQTSVLKAGNLASKENIAQRRRGRSSKTNENSESDLKLVPSKDAKCLERNVKQPLLKMNHISQTKFADLEKSLNKLSTSDNTEVDDLVKEFNELQLTFNPETTATSETERRRLDSRLSRLQLRIKLMEKRSKLLQSIN